MCFVNFPFPIHFHVGLWCTAWFLFLQPLASLLAHTNLGLWLSVLVFKQDRDLYECHSGSRNNGSHSGDLDLPWTISGAPESSLVSFQKYQSVAIPHVPCLCWYKEAREKKLRSSGVHFNRFLNSDPWAAACWATMSLPWLSRNLSLAGFLVTLQHFLFPSTGSTAKEQSFGCPRPSISFRIRKCYHAHQLEKESKEMGLSTQWFWVKGHIHT